MVAKVHREPTKLKTKKNERRGLGAAICLDEVGMVKVVYVAIAEMLLLLLSAAICGACRKPEVSKLMRGGANRLSCNGKESVTESK